MLPISRGGVFSLTILLDDKGLGRISLVAASAAQSAATVVQAGTKDLTSKVREGGYDQKVNETVNVVTSKTTELGQKSWGIMKGVMAMASQKLEEYTKEGVNNWKADDNWQQNNNEKNNGFYQDYGQRRNVPNSSEEKLSKNYNSINSWDDWDEKNEKEETSKKGNDGGDSWAGWDDAKDDDDDSYCDHRSTNKGVNQNGKSSSLWTDGGFI